MGDVLILDNDLAKPWLTHIEAKSMASGLPKIRAFTFRHLPVQNYDVYQSCSCPQIGGNICFMAAPVYEVICQRHCLSISSTLIPKHGRASDK
jgi:hypothetical protein